MAKNMQVKGFHTSLSTRISLHAQHAYASCNLFVLYELPPDVIVDSFELNDHGLQFEFVGNANLEFPILGVGNEIGWLLVAVDAEKEITVDVPLHLRYGVPGEGHNPRHMIQLHPPTSFWGCPSSHESLHGILPSQSPQFAMLNASTQFEIIEHTTSLPLSANIPLGNINHILYVELGTVTVTLFAFVYIAHCCWALSKTLYSAHLKTQ